jgi:hypothetical protein
MAAKTMGLDLTCVAVVELVRRHPPRQIVSKQILSRRLKDVRTTWRADAPHRAWEAGEIVPLRCVSAQDRSRLFSALSRLTFKVQLVSGEHKSKFGENGPSPGKGCPKGRVRAGMEPTSRANCDLLLAFEFR